MATDKKSGSAMDLSIRIKDERYSIPVYLGSESPAFTLRFNPGDIFVLEYADNIEKLKAPDAGDRESALRFSREMERNLDGIFGEGSTRLISKYAGISDDLVQKLIQKVREAYADFQKRFSDAKKEAQANAVIEAKKAGAQYRANQ